MYTTCKLISKVTLLGYANTLPALKLQPTRSLPFNLVTAWSLATQVCAPHQPVVENPSWIWPMVLLSQCNGRALDRTPTSHFTQPTQMASMVLEFKTLVTQAPVLASQIKTVMDMLLLSELIFTSHPVMILAKDWTLTRRTCNSQLTETARRVGFILLISSMRSTGTPPYSRMSGHRAKENSLLSLPTETPLATLSTLTL